MNIFSHGLEFSGEEIFVGGLRDYSVVDVKSVFRGFSNNFEDVVHVGVVETRDDVGFFHLRDGLFVDIELVEDLDFFLLVQQEKLALDNTLQRRVQNVANHEGLGVGQLDKLQESFLRDVFKYADNFFVRVRVEKTDDTAFLQISDLVHKNLDDPELGFQSLVENVDMFFQVYVSELVDVLSCDDHYFQEHLHDVDEGGFVVFDDEASEIHLGIIYYTLLSIYVYCQIVNFLSLFKKQ